MKKPRNKFELDGFKHLTKKKIKFEYEAQKIPYIFSGHYIPDFTIHKTRDTMLVEYKGYFRPEDKRKLAAVKKCHPALDIRIVFYSYNKASVRWADKHGFPWALKTIPDEWLKDD